MKQKSLTWLYACIIFVFVLLCGFAVFELLRTNVRGEAADWAGQIDRLKSDLKSQQEENSRLASQINELYSNYQKLQNDYNSLKEQVSKIGLNSTRTDSNAKTVYLTFDDGPSPLTPRILDALSQNGVKATFFVIGTQCMKYEDYLKRINAEGHVIGIHSWTHKFNIIYASGKNYFDDFNKLRDYLINLTGKSPDVCRFPGGTNNTVSQKYSDRIIAKILPKVLSMGIRPVDWNAYAGDAEKKTPTRDEVVSNVMKNVRGKQVVVLFHDTQRNSGDVEALPIIIAKCRALGYTFGVLTNSSPVVQFKPA